MAPKFYNFKALAMADLRARIGEAVDAVAKGGEFFVIERKGKPLACLVPVSEFQTDISSSRIHEEIDELERAKEIHWNASFDSREIVVCVPGAHKRKSHHNYNYPPSQIPLRSAPCHS